ncbi:MAG: CoA-binding protein [Bacteroidales bacterium]|nr:CoA-binding protein [Bacteroidales bacterium]
MVKKETIEKFLAPKKLAIAGVSRDPKKFGNQVFKELRDKGYEIFPINPNTEKIDGVNCYKNVSALPGHIKQLVILTPKSETDAILREAINHGIKNIWVQQMSETSETIKIAEEYQVELIHNKCIYMFAEPVTGFHKFHRTLLKLFGRLPK